MMLTGLARIARKTGYPVKEIAGWETRTRPGGMESVQTITFHHTANGGAAGDYPSLRVVRDGRSGLPGPLAQYGVGVSGTIYVIAAGRCNHAGVSKLTAYTNPHAIGIEAEAVGVPGTKKDWPPRQKESLIRLGRALVDEFPSVTVADVLGHKETCSPSGRKTDPSFNMDLFRKAVAACDLSKPPKELNPTAEEKEDDTVATSELDDETIARIQNLGNDIMKQSFAGFIKTAGDRTKVVYDRTAAANLQAVHRAALTAALNDPEDPLNIWLTRIEEKLDQALAPGSE